MSYEEIVDGIVRIFNTPTCYGLTIGSLIIIIFWFIFTKTSFGKKSLNILKEKIESSVKELTDAKEQLKEVSKEYNEYKELSKQTIKDIKNEYEVRLEGARQEVKSLEKVIISTAENVHNANVKEALENYAKEKVEFVECETNEIIEKAKEEARSEYENEILSLKQELTDLKNEILTSKELLKETKNECENTVNEVKNDIKEVVEDVKGE